MQGSMDGFACRWRGLVALGCLVLAASPALAGRQDVGPVSAELPAGWRASQEGNAVIFLSADNSCHVSLIAARIEAADREEIARDRAQLTATATFGPAGPGFAFEGNGGRYWLAVSGDGLVEFAASGCPEANELLASFRPGSRASASVEAALAAIRRPDVAAWLAYEDTPFALAPFEAETPAAASMPDFAAYGAAAADGEPPVGISADLPDGWSRTTAGTWTVFASADGDRWLAARTYRLPEGDDFGAYLDFAKGLARKLGGRNISSDEGMVSFETPEGNSAGTELYGDILLLTVFAGDGEGLGGLLSTVVPAEE